MIVINNHMVNSAAFHWASSQKLAAASLPGKGQRKARLATKTQPGIQTSVLLATRPPSGRKEASSRATCAIGRAHSSQEAKLHLAYLVPQLKYHHKHHHSLKSETQVTFCCITFPNAKQDKQFTPKYNSPSNCRTQNLSG